MKRIVASFIALIVTLIANAQKVELKPENFSVYGVALKRENYKGKDALVVDQSKDNDNQYTQALLKDVDFHNGIIEISVAGQPKANAIQTARGFVGITFRAQKDTSKFELFYIRPSNGRAEDQIRRNHSTQYVSHPGFPWEKLRKETPEKYEAYTDLLPGEWTKIKIEVKDDKAKLYVNGAEQPALIVNDLKQGKDQRGSIGLWIGIGTLAHFTDLKITKFD